MEKFKLTLEEYLEIRERRSQDDLSTLIDYLDGYFGTTPPREPSTADAPPHPAPEEQTVVTVAPDTAPPPIPEDVAAKSAAAKKPSAKR